MTEKSWLDEELEREKRQKNDISFKESIVNQFKKWFKIESPSKHRLMYMPSTDSLVLVPTDSFVNAGVSAKEANENFISLANSWTRFSAMPSIESTDLDEDELYSCSILGMKLAYEKEDNK